MSIIHKRWLGRSMLALGAALAMVFFAANPAAALSDHTATLQDGSVIDIENGRTFLLAGDPQCSDGLDNDEDGGTDAGAGGDTECDAESGGMNRPATDDDNECVDGFQAPNDPPTFDFVDDGMGGLSNFDVMFGPPADVCTQNAIIGQVCFAIEIVVDASSATGTVNATTGEIVAGPFNFVIDVEECTHDVPPGFDGTNCEVAFNNVTFSTSHPRGVPYSESGGVGQATLATTIPSGPAFTSGDCGGFFGTDYADELNAAIGLPNNVDVVLVQEVVPDLTSVP